ncbi:MAG: hypothetical protein PHP73_05010 [Candidatus Omnitrophica bacterium]|nr:hypothetical protein [Candidatus Omnitrophota bacterium]
MDNAKVKAQVALEFVTAFICTILLLVLTTQLLVWFGNNIVNRQKAYESTRSMALTLDTSEPVVPKKDFYTPSKLKIFGNTEELPK